MMNVELTQEELNKVSGGHFGEENSILRACKCTTFFQYIKDPNDYHMAYELFESYAFDDEFHTPREFLEALRHKGFISDKDYYLVVEDLERPMPH